MEKDWIFGEHPLIARLASDEERVWSLLRGATWWLPLPDSFLFQAPLPTDDQAMIATLGGLRKELEKLLITRKKCPQLRSRLQWRTGGIRS